jgi:hypothetical protein
VPRIQYCTLTNRGFTWKTPPDVSSLHVRGYRGKEQSKNSSAARSRVTQKGLSDCAERTKPNAGFYLSGNAALLPNLLTLANEQRIRRAPTPRRSTHRQLPARRQGRGRRAAGATLRADRPCRGTSLPRRASKAYRSFACCHGIPTISSGPGNHQVRISRPFLEHCGNRRSR